MDLKAAIAHVADRKDLTSDEMAVVVGQIMDGEATPAQVGALLIALRMKGETVAEVVGGAQAMRARMIRVPAQEPVLVDMCGTGGDGAGTVNVSTLASFIAAGAGVKVAKHGNRALSSRSGSHDVLEALGLAAAPGPDLAVRCLDEAGLAFLFAPAYHAATRHAAGPRREIGVRTLFNLLGPLTNPAGARRHAGGVFTPERTDFLAHAHRELGSERALVFCANLPGGGHLDELSPGGPTQVAELHGGEVTRRTIGPEDFGLRRVDPAGLAGGDPTQNAARLVAILEAGDTPGQPAADEALRTAALMAAGAAVHVAGAAADLEAATEQARAALDDGRARGVLETLRRLTPATKAAE